MRYDCLEKGNRGNYMMMWNKGFLGCFVVNMVDCYVLIFEWLFVVGVWKIVLNFCFVFDVCICIFCFGIKFLFVLKLV